ncbi:hypothetical protein [Fibrobacter succinogenes]|uniref:hypothetical protein n=1 Tax=Fibrobacter succinogenes TaxID=833 RepID=UPI00156990A3|nr:hypothetical protein [Fibrobacter succinogenes]
MSYRTNKAQQNLLNQFLSEHGVQLSEETLDKLYQFADLVVDTKEYGNLISANPLKVTNSVGPIWVLVQVAQFSRLQLPCQTCSSMQSNHATCA